MRNTKSQPGLKRNCSIAALAGLLALVIVFPALSAIPGTTNYVWTVGGVRGAAALGPDGNIYVASSDHNLYAFDPSAGTTSHVWTTGADIYSGPAIDSQGRIYIGSLDNKLYMFNSDGTTNLAWTLNGDIQNTPAIGADGTIYVGTVSKYFYALNPSSGATGHIWTAGSYFRCSAIISKNGTIYVGNDDSKFYAFNPDGTTNHVWNCAAQVSGAASIDALGNILAADQAGYVYSFNPNGTTNRVWKCGTMVYQSSPVIGTNNHIYVTAYHSPTGFFYDLHPLGTTSHVWTLTEDITEGPPTVADNGSFLAGCGYKLYACGASGTTNVYWDTGGYIRGAPLITKDGKIYVGIESGGKFYCFNGIYGPANTRWPRFMQNPRNTGLEFYAPENIYATRNAFSDKIRILWNNVSAANGYIVSRSTNSASATAAQIGLAATNYYNDTSASPNIKYYYWITATNDWTVSSFSSNNWGIYLSTLTAPSAPANVKASDGIYTNKISITWDTVTNAASYEVWRNTANDSATSSHLGATEELTYDDTTAVADTTYYFWAKAVNAAGTSSFSAAASGKRASTLTVPATPQNIQASQGAYTNQVALAWDQVSGAASYKIYRSTLNESNSAAWLADATTEAYLDTAVTVGTVYYYWITAVNGAGASAYSSVASGYAAESLVAPSAPSNLSASKGTYSDRVRLTWDAVSNAAAYEVYRNTVNDSATATKLDPDATVAPFDDATVAVDTTYYYWVKAKNDAGVSGFSFGDSGYAVTMVVTPVAPTNVAATKGAYTDRVRVSWTAVSNATAYEVYRNTANNSSAATKLNPDATVSPFDDATVAVDTTYYYWVKAKNDAGSSEFSAPDSGYASSSLTPPSAPAYLSATKGTFSDRVQISWTTVSNASSYEIYRNTVDDSASAAKLEPDATIPPFDDTLIAANTIYYYWIKAKNYSGKSSFSMSAVGYASSSGSDTRWLPVVGDYDGDGTADPAVYQAATGTWRLKLSTAGYIVFTTAAAFLGGTNYTGLAADFDGDAKTDPAIYNTLDGYWSFRLSSAGYAQLNNVIMFGGANYAALAADFDGDTKADPTLYQAAASAWTIKLSSANYYNIPLPNFMGATGWTAFGADFDGDAKADPAIYWDSSGYWIIKLSGVGYVEVAMTSPFGGAGYLPVAGDFDGDRLADPAIYNYVNGDWSIMLSSAAYYRLNLPAFLGGME